RRIRLRYVQALSENGARDTVFGVPPDEVDLTNTLAYARKERPGQCGRNSNARVWAAAEAHEQEQEVPLGAIGAGAFNREEMPERILVVCVARQAVEHKTQGFSRLPAIRGRLDLQPAVSQK